MKKRGTSRFLSVLLTLCVALSVASVSANAEDQVFTDVPEGAWYFDAVNYSYMWGLMNGTGDDKFEPNANLNRGMIVTILYRYEGEPGVAGLDNPFTDVPEGTWYTDAVKWAAANNIVNGYGDGRFGPNDAVTKEQMALLVYRIGESGGMMPPTMGAGRDFRDLATVNDWAYDAVSKLNDMGVFVNLPGENFRPNIPATRAEVASILYRYIVIMSAVNDGFSG